MLHRLSPYLPKPRLWSSPLPLSSANHVPAKPMTMSSSSISITPRHYYSHQTKMTPDISKAHVTGIKELEDPKWVRTNLIEYVDPNGKARDWEFCSRRTRVEGGDCDGVGIICVLHKPDGPELLLQKQFRPPVDGICIEVPAGLLDPNESIETCAERELKEETGYIGKARKKSPIMFNDPGFCNTNTRMVHVDVDLTDERNKNPQPELEENEFIECFSVPLRTLPEELRKLSEQGYKLDGRVANLADGIELAQSLGL